MRLFQRIKKLIKFDEFLEFLKRDWSKYYILIFSYLAIVISINYYFDLEDAHLDRYKNSIQGLFQFFILNVFVYAIPLFFIVKNEHVLQTVKSKKFWILLGIALLSLSFYQSTNLLELFFPSYFKSNYFEHKLSFRLNSIIKYVLIFICLGIFIGKLKHKGYGLLNFNINFKTYFGFLLCMLPLLVFASTQEEFLKVYPKLKQMDVPFNLYFEQLIIYEPIYLLDFLMIEWFFRGFMVLFFVKYLDKKSILFAALIYCSFHFGKPLLECISSFFGGYVLGYMVYKSNSIWGGVIVHMGIAFLMDCFAFISKSYV